MGAPRPAGSSVLKASSNSSSRRGAGCFRLETELFCHKAQLAVFTEATEMLCLLCTCSHLTEGETKALGSEKLRGAAEVSQSESAGVRLQTYASGF